MRKKISVCLIFVVLLGLISPGISAVYTGNYSTDMLPSATAQEIHELFLSRSENIHPRILASEEDFLRIRRNIEEDDYLKTCYARVYLYCEEELSRPVSAYLLPDGTRPSNLCKMISQRVSWMAMLYRITGDGRFAERAIAEMLSVAAFPTWKLGNFLDIAQIAYGVGLGYDWLYYEMTPSERQSISKALYEYAVAPAEGDWFKTLTSNWNPWCHGGVTIAACAIYEDYPAECAAFLAGAVQDIRKSLEILAPMGAYPEGPAYSQVGSLFSALFFESFETVLGTDFGLSELIGFKEFGKYLPAMTGFVNSFNFGDGGEQILDGAVHHWFAKRYHMPELSLYQKKVQTESWDEHLELLWYDPDLVANYDSGEERLDYLMYSNEGQSVASFRSNPEDAYQIYTAIKSGYNGTSHTDMDVGTFVLEAMGIRWITELGADDYGIPGYGTFDNVYGYGEDNSRWKVYRKRTEGQNTLLVNPSQRGGQDANALCQITDYRSSYNGGYAIVDMLDAYDSYGVDSICRGVSLFDDRSRVLLRDEITCESASEIYWFAHTKAQITLSADGRTAELSQNGKALLAQIVEPANGRFTTMAADPLPSSPVITGEYSRQEYRKLAIHLEDVITTALTVVFTPVLSQKDRQKMPISVPLTDFESLAVSYEPGTVLQEQSGVYEICNAEELIAFSHMVNSGNSFYGKTVRLMNDIDLSGRSMDPIGGGRWGKAFQGTFDGNCHVVKNVCMFHPGLTQTGFFGYLYGAKIRNFGIESGIVFGGKTTAALAGIAHNTSFENCFNKAPVIGNGGHIGGIVGQLSGISTITNCYNNGDVLNSAYIAGGIVGYVSSGATVEIANCYHRGMLEDSADRCGLIGFYNTTVENMLPKSVILRNSYATTPLKCGEMLSVPEIETYESVAQLTETQMMAKAVTLGVSFMDDCEQTNGGYPVLSWESDVTMPHDLILKTESQLRLLSYLVNSGKNSFYKQTVKLGCDVDLGSRAWHPIGGNMATDIAGKAFSGTFDGQGYKVKNLSVVTDRYMVGFFGSVYGTIRNFGIEGGVVVGKDKVGGITGHLIGSLENCYNKASVKGNSLIGGLVGISGKSAFSNCYNTGSVTATHMAGGLIGYFFSASSGSKLTNCYNAGSIAGNSPGQLVSNIHGSVLDITFENCYATEVPFVSNTSDYSMIGGGNISPEDLRRGGALLGKAFTYDYLRPTNRGFPILNVFFYHITDSPVLTKDGEGIYHIHNADELYALSYLVNVENHTFTGETICLDTDIDLQNRLWVPIGGNASYHVSDPPSFKGCFRGQGHRIRNLSILSGNDDVGLFGYVYEGTVENLGIESGLVFGGKYAGGLVGYARSAMIRNCYNRSGVNGKDSVGGIAGILSGTDSLIENCYNTACILGDSSFGGLLGTVGNRAINASIRNGYHTGPKGWSIGAVITGAVNTTIENTYTLSENPGMTSQSSVIVKNCEEVSLDQLRSLSDSLGGGFDEDYLVQNRLLPVLAWQNDGCKTELPIKDGSYEISNGRELRLLSYLVRKGNTFNGKQIILKGNIDLENKPWLPIGGYDESRGYAFLGTFDGRGYVIRNMLSVEMENNHSGLFGRVYGGTIKNVGLENSVSIAKQNAGGLIANMEKGSKLQNSYTTATVYGNSMVGGLTATLGGPDCLIENCYNVGLISAQYPNKMAAGLIGYLASSAKNFRLQNCYNVGNFYGLVGLVNEAAVNNRVINTYAAGSTMLYNLPEGLVSQSVERLSSATLKTYEETLGTAFDKDVFGVNRGYPILSWQSGRECFHEYSTESDGNATHSTICSRCGKRTTELHSWGNGTIIEEPSCVESGNTVFSCTVCKEVKCETIAAYGHNYIYTGINGQIHRITCGNCDLITEAYHTYTDGYCICGESEHKEPVTDPKLMLVHSLNLASDISVNLAVSKANLRGFDMDTVYLESSIDIYEGNEKIGITIIRIEPVESEYYYYFTMNGLTAVQMNDTITSTLYGTKDGQRYCSPVDVYSIAAYAYSQMNKTTIGDHLKTLCADLLRYGAMAQNYKNYRTDALADANMTDAHRAYLSDIDAVTFGNTNQILNHPDNAPITWAGKALNLESKVALKFIFNPAGYHGDVKDLTLRISYEDVNGDRKNVTLGDPELYNEAMGYYVFTFDGLLAAELRSVVSAQIYAGETPVSCTLQYSADTYGNNKAGNLLDLCKALFAYSDCAKAYFASDTKFH